MHPWLAEHIRWLVVAHAMSAFAFVLVHGPSVAALMALRRERQLERVRALLSMSGSAAGWTWGAIMLLGISGLALAAAEHTWKLPWLWGSALVLFLVAFSMSPLAARAFNEARHAAGLPYFDGRGVAPPGPVDHAALDVALRRIARRAPWIAAIGVVGLALLVWLMVARPS